MKPITPNLSQFSLTPWQRKQAAMLYYYSSLDYLTELQKRVRAFLTGTVDPVLDQAKAQNRDALLTDARWGNRNTSQNWANYGWPFLKDLQLALAKDIALRPSGVYSITTVNECLRGLENFSLDWMTPGEMQAYETAVQQINNWASPLDNTMAGPSVNKWSDYHFAYYYPSFAANLQKIPRFRIRTETIYRTGEVPHLAGVYISKDDPHAALQFAWPGNRGMELRMAKTFNDVGLAALSDVGRDDLWFDADKMLHFATTSHFAPALKDEVTWDGVPCSGLAASAVARSAFLSRKSEWYFLEPVQGEFDSLADLSTAESNEQHTRIVGGEVCTEAGFYFSPAHLGSRRYFSAGETTPTIDNEYGRTFWQWDLKQDK